MNLRIKELSESLVNETQKLSLLFALTFSEDQNLKDKIKGSPEFNGLKNKSFTIEYQKWYTKSLILIKQITPERLDEFVSLYKNDKKIEHRDVSNYTISDAIAGYVLHNSIKPVHARSKLDIQFSIVCAANELIETRTNDILTLLNYEVFEQEIESARFLLKNGFVRSSGAICGVLLEKHLKTLLKKANLIPNTKNPSISTLAQQLYEEKIIDSSQFKFISYLGELRNKCDHDKEIEPTKDEIVELINGTNKVISSYN